MRAALIAVLLFAAPAWAGVDFENADTDYYLTSTVFFTEADLPVSVMVWLKPESLPTQTTMFCVSNSSTAANYYRFALLDTGACRWNARDGGANSSADTSNTITAGDWRHFVGVENATNDRYSVLDGDWSNRGTASADVVMDSASDQTTIGALTRSLPTQDYVDGVMAHLTVWKGYALTQRDVEALAAGAHPLTVAPEKVAYYFPLRGDGPAATRVRCLVSGLSVGPVVAASKGDSPPLHGPRPYYGQLGHPRLFRLWTPDTAYRREGYAVAA